MMHVLTVALYAVLVLNAALVLLLFVFGGRFDYDEPGDTFDARVADALTVADPAPYLRSVQ